MVLAPWLIVIHCGATCVHCTLPLELRRACRWLLPFAFSLGWNCARASKAAFFMAPRCCLPLFHGWCLCRYTPRILVRCVIPIFCWDVTFHEGPRILLQRWIVSEEARCNGSFSRHASPREHQP